MRLVTDIADDGALSDRYQQAIDLHHYVEWDQKVGENGSHSCLSPERLVLRFAAYLDVICIESVENLEIPLKIFADVCPQDGVIQSLFPSLVSYVSISAAVIGNSHVLFVGHRNSSK